MKQSKMNIPKWLLLYASVSIINQAAIVDADYLVSVRIHNYSNPTNQCPTCSAENNHCCDIQRPGGVCDECNTFFQYCVQMFGGGSKECRDSHQYVDPGRTTLDFSQEFLSRVSHIKGAHINLIVFDRDLNEPQNDLLNEVQVNLTVKDIQLGVETLPKTYTGPMGYSNITLSFYVTCAENWYGPYCNINPISVQEPWTGAVFYLEVSDHDLVGKVEYNIYNNISLGVETKPVHFNTSTGSSIVLSFKVVCAESYYSPDCSRFCTEECTCDPGFTGEFCHEIDDSYGRDCGKNGQCTSMDGANAFTCVCDDEYTGEHCEVQINECNRLNITCSEHGQCISEGGSHRCECDPSFTGGNCEGQISGSALDTKAVVGGTIGISVFLFLLMLVVLTTVIIVIRKKNKKGKNHALPFSTNEVLEMKKDKK